MASSKSKGARIKVCLASTGTQKDGKSTGYFKTTVVNVRTQQAANTGKLELKKFDPRAWNEKTGRCGKKVLFKQKKLPK